MKRSVFLGVMLAFTISGFAQQKANSPFEGAWKLAGITSVSGNSKMNWNKADFGDQVKMWTGNHFSFTGVAKYNNTDQDMFGYGTYTLNGKNYIESIVFHNYKPLINTKFECTLEFRNDTLYQTSQNVDSTGKKLEGSFTVEKYIKLK